MFFDSWQSIYRVLIVGALAYIALVFFLRISGKRTLSKMNAFDFIVTVALGSTLATVLLSKDVALLEGITALGLLIFLQYAVTWLSVRSDAFQGLLKATPSLLLYRGQYLTDAMKRERVTEEEVLAALRRQGVSSDEVEAVVLETEGKLAIIKKPPEDETRSALRNVQGHTHRS